MTILTEAERVIADRFSSGIKCVALKDIAEKRLARGDVIEDRRITKVAKDE